MTWFQKAIDLLKKISPETAAAVEIGVDTAKGTASFAKLTYRMGEAAVVNVEEGFGKVYRAITGTGGMPVFNTQEGPLKSSVSLQDAVQLAKGAYQKEGGSREGYRTVSTVEVKDLGFSVYESEADGHVVVSFRGSNSFANWKRNLNFLMKDDGHGNKVHGGFKNAWDELKPYVDKELFELFGSNKMTNNVTFTGHSSGGAIAQLALSDYTNSVEGDERRLMDAVTFASPVVGDAGFNASIPGGHLMNVADPRDSIPKITQQLHPGLKENKTAIRWIAVVDRAARKNDEVKKDAIKFGIELSFDLGIAAIMAYAPGLFAEGAEAAGPEAAEAALAEGLALEEAVIAAAEESAGVGVAAEEAAALESIGGLEGEAFSGEERMELRSLLNPESRAEVMEQLRNIDLKAAIVEKAGEIDWETTISRALATAGISKAAQNLIRPFLSENMEGVELNEEKVKFLLDNSFEFMYGSVVAHPIDTYIKNIDTRFGDQRDNAREDMWHNYQKNLEKEGADPTDMLEFLTEDEVSEFQGGFHHGRRFAGPETEDVAGDEGEDADDEAETDDEEDEDTLGDDEIRVINGEPLHVVKEGLERKPNGERIFAVVDEDGETIAYSGPSHATSTTTLYGNWTGMAPRANDFPVKTGGGAFSALDTFSLAYVANSYTSGYHNHEADSQYIKRITAAFRNGHISESIDSEEARVARVILHHFRESGHIFAAHETALAEKGQLVSGIDAMVHGVLGDAEGSLELSVGQKRKAERILESPGGGGVAADLLQRDAKRLKSNLIETKDIMEDGMRTIEFNLRSLKALGLEKGPQYAALMRGAQETALAYKTALNVEERISECIREAQSVNSGATFNRESADSLFPNVLAGNAPSEVNEDESHLSGHGEYFKDIAVSEILHAII